MAHRRWHDLPFRTKLVVYSGVITASALFIAGIALVTMETKSYREQLAARVTAAADITSQTSASALVFDDADFATRLLTAISVDLAVDRAVLFDAEGGVFASYLRPEHDMGDDLPTVDNLVDTRFTASHLEITRPVIFGNEQVGLIYVRADLTELATRIRYFGLGSLVLFAAVMALSLLLASVLQRGLRRPIVELQSTADRISSERDYSLRARQFGHDDLGRLTVAFNGMLEQIQKREAALEASESRYSHLLGRIDEVVFRMTLPDGQLEFCSPGARRVFGYSDEELLADPGLYHKLVHPDSRSAFDDMVTAAAAGKVVPAIEYRIVDREGRDKWIMQTNYAVRNQAEEVISLEGFFVETTERVVADQERELLRNELSQAHKLEALGTLSGGIAHDFNNILGAIMGNASLGLDDLPDDHPVAEFLETILRASERASSLTRQILAFSRQSRVEQQPVDLGLVLDETLTLLRASLPSTISIKTDISVQVPRVMADPTQLHQVIMNLCTNASHAMRERGGLLEVRLQSRRVTDQDRARTPGLGDGPFVEVVVADTGEGMTSEVQERIFEPFFTTKGDGDGTGMGLSVVYGIVREHGGSIAVESAVGEGTTFRVLLPALDLVDGGDDEAPSQEIRTGEGRVLVVDDEEMITQVAERMLSRLGYEVTTFTNPWKALEAFQNAPDDFDVVITDYTMPNLVGLDLARRILELRPDLPVIITTGDYSRVDAAEVQRLRTVRMAHKPFDLKEISGLVHESLTRRS